MVADVFSLSVYTCHGAGYASGRADCCIVHVESGKIKNILVFFFGSITFYSGTITNELVCSGPSVAVLPI